MDLIQRRLIVRFRLSPHGTSIGCSTVGHKLFRRRLLSVWYTLQSEAPSCLHSISTESGISLLFRKRPLLLLPNIFTLIRTYPAHFRAIFTPPYWKAVSSTIPM